MKKLTLLALCLLPLLSTAQTIFVGGTPSGTVTLKSNTNYANLTIDGSNAKVNLVTGNNVSNIKIHKLYLRNTRGFAILLNGCTNITIDSTFFNNIGFGVYAQSGSKQIQVLACQFLNVNGIDKASLGHAVQFNAVTGAGNRINLNRVENVKNITDTSSHPHDLLSLFQCNGIVGDSIQVNYNWIRGGQLVAWPTSGSTGDGIGLSDVGGNYQVARGNILVNPGCAGIQVIANGLGGGKGIKAEYNIIYSKQTPVSTNGINIQNPIQMNMSNNRTNWTNFRGLNVLLPDGETQYDYFNSPVPIGLNTNSWKDASVTPSVLPNVIITMAEAGTAAPNISYNSPNTYTVGQSFSLPVSNIGGAVVSYSTTGLPSGLSLNTSTGLISGTVTTQSVATNYNVTGTNALGSSTFPIRITVNSAPIGVPVISYSTPQVYTQGVVITPLNVTSTGGAVTSYSGALPAGLSLNASTGQITGTPTVVITPGVVYTVTATNASGTGKANINITVNSPAVVAPHITYTTSSLSAIYGYTIPVLTPSNSGGSVVSWSITPTLPSGLNFNAGVISGTPTNVVVSGQYVVSATNSGGTGKDTLTIAVGKAPLTITAISTSKLQGTPNPDFQVAYSGLKLHDTGISTSPTISTTAIQTSPNGNYPITLTGGASNFYTLTLVDGNLNIFSGAQITGVHFGGIVQIP